MAFPMEIERRALVRSDEHALSLVFDGEGDAAAFHAMARDARAYIESWPWSGTVVESYFGGGLRGVVALVLVRLDDSRATHVDEWLWVVVGDVPSAFFEIDDSDTGAVALETYCALMDDWISAVRGASPLSLDEVFPVRAEPSGDRATLLEGRLETLRGDILLEIAAQGGAMAAWNARAGDILPPGRV